MNYLQKLLLIISEVCGTDEPICADTDLFEKDLLDSLAFINLLEAIEDEYNVSIQPTRVKRSSFQTPQRIMELISAGNI